VTYPHTPQPGPRPGPPPGGFRPGPPPQGFRPGQLEQPPEQPPAAPAEPAENPAVPAVAAAVPSTGHPAVDAVLRSLANAAQLAPADQIAEYEAVHRVLQETLTSIDG
jgi:predicted component of type VI protein secretion system